ncbi:NADP-dependent malic enzyme-like, partial [Homalodisca vitripennis]|uniref:NADP-dependent malic enzyme-like n=1 Tax=Homalodisca vitripennis TaxID=197043 RepID=UPI001EEB21FE
YDSELIVYAVKCVQASIGIAELCVMAMKTEGTSEAEARSKIWLVDSKGLITKDRPDGGISDHKAKFAHARSPIKTLAEAVETLKPNILIGAAAVAGAFTPEIIQTMAANNKRPIIFALSNPTSKAECTAEQAYIHTNGTAVFASGSPFAPVTYKGQTFVPGQGNNSYIFPGVALGVICAGIRHISEEVFLIASSTLAQMVSEDDLNKGSLYPPLHNIQTISTRIATRVAEHAYEKGMASTYPEPQDKETFIKSQLYDTKYRPSLPRTYTWPKC